MSNAEYMRQYMREYRQGLRRTRACKSDSDLIARAKVMRGMVETGEMDPLLALSWVIDPPENFKNRLAA